MTLSQLRYAITVADSRSMNQAAQKLFISQPSLSAAIRELEDEVGIEIFRRTNRGIQVTPDGEEFVGPGHIPGASIEVLVQDPGQSPFCLAVIDLLL